MRTSRLKSFMAVLAAAVIVTTAQADCVTSLAPLPTDSTFAATSFWYQPIPANVELHPNSANFAAEFNRQRVKYYGTVQVNVSSYTAPVYTVPDGAPVTKVGWNNCQNKTWVETAMLAQLSAVPIPSFAVAASGTDTEMAIYQPSTDTYWELWQAKKDVNGAWIACWGGKLTGASKSQGIMPKPYGTTATGLPFVGGQITAEELQRGVIKHAIGIALVDAEHFNKYSWPANRSDGYNPTAIANRIAEGQRFRIDPTIDVNSLPISRAAKIIAKAGQVYGFVVWDKAGALSVRVQNPASYTSNPYPELFEGVATNVLLKTLPWNSIQFLPFDYGKPVL